MITSDSTQKVSNDLFLRTIHFSDHFARGEYLSSRAFTIIKGGWINCQTFQFGRSTPINKDGSCAAILKCHFVVRRTICVSASPDGGYTITICKWFPNGSVSAREFKASIRRISRIVNVVGAIPYGWEHESFKGWTTFIFSQTWAAKRIFAASF